MPDVKDCQDSNHGQDCNDTKNPHAIIGHLARSNLAAQFSEQMAIAAIPILAVVALGVSAQESATLQAVNTLPFLLLSIPAGLLADRCPRKHLMIVTELIRAAALFVLFALFFTQVLGLAGLAILGFALVTGTVVYSVAAPALVAALVARDDLLAANRRLEIARSIAFTAGPAAGGVLAGWASGLFAFLAALALSLASVWYLAKLPVEPRAVVAKTAAKPAGTDTGTTTPMRHILQELAEGLRFIARNRYLRPIVATSFVYNTAWYLLLGIFAYYAIRHLDFSASAVGAALGVYGAGMVVGAFLSRAIARVLRFGLQILLGPLCAATAALLLLATLAAPVQIAYVCVFAAFFLFGFGPIVWTITTTSLRQIVTPGGLIARVSSVIMTATFGARPLGAALGAWLSATLGVTSCLIGVALGFALQLTIITLSAPARLATIDALGEGGQ